MRQAEREVTRACYRVMDAYLEGIAEVRCRSNAFRHGATKTVIVGVDTEHENRQIEATHPTFRANGEREIPFQTSNLRRARESKSSNATPGAVCIPDVGVDFEEIA